MQTDLTAQTNIALHDEVPFETRQQVMEHVAATEQSRIRETGQMATRAQSIVKGYQQRLTQLLGLEKYDQYRAHVLQQKQNYRQQYMQTRQALLLKSAEVPLGEIRQIEQQRLQEMKTAHELREREALSYLRNLGVDAARFQALRRETHEQLEAFVPGVPWHDGRPVVRILPQDVPESIRTGKTNPWTTYRPPYPGWSWYYNGWRAGFNFSPTLFLDSNTGIVGNSIYLTDSDAGDADVGFENYNASVGFWYQMPTTGLVEAWVEAQVAEDLHNVYLSDEWGFSDSAVHQRNYITMKVDGAASGEWRDSLMSAFDEQGETDRSWYFRDLVSGGTYWAHLYSNTAFPAGSWVHVNVGTRDYEYCFANDVSTYAEVKFRWFLKSVWVESTGA